MADKREDWRKSEWAGRVSGPENGRPVLPERIRFGTPDIDKLGQEGFVSVDMHVHSSWSDAAPSVRQILADARHKRIGIAITDHNEAGAFRHLESSRPGVLVIPGIELDCAEGPHILLFFYSRNDLADFYDRHIRDRRRKSQVMISYPAADTILSAAEGYSCLKIAAHPFGYFGLDRGVLKCDARGLLPGVVSRLDGIEVICGGMTRKVNRLAAAYADATGIPVTGGSDAHILREVGRAVTAVRAGSTEEFLDGIRRGESVVAGSSSGITSRGATAAIIGFHYIPYSASLMHTRIGPHTAQLTRSLSRIFRK